MPHEFVGISQWLGRQYGIIADHDRIFEAPALDQSVVKQESDFIVKTKRAGMRQLPLPDLGRNFGAIMLGKAPLAIGAGARDLKHLVRKEGHYRFAHLQLDRRRQSVS